jgi:hypothetical protein
MRNGVKNEIKLKCLFRFLWKVPHPHPPHTNQRKQSTQAINASNQRKQSKASNQKQAIKSKQSKASNQKQAIAQQQLHYQSTFLNHGIPRL